MKRSTLPLVLRLSAWAIALGGCGSTAEPTTKDPAAPQAIQAMLAANAQDPTQSEADNLNAAFRDQTAALKEVEVFLEQMFEDPEKGLPSKTLDELSQRVVETHQRLIGLLPFPPTPAPGLHREPLAIEQVMFENYDAMLELRDRVGIQLEKAAMLSDTDKEKLLKLAAQLQGRTGPTHLAPLLPSP